MEIRLKKCMICQVARGWLLSGMPQKGLGKALHGMYKRRRTTCDGRDTGVNVVGFGRRTDSDSDCNFIEVIWSHGQVPRYLCSYLLPSAVC
jgi:hypothetical protein